MASGAQEPATDPSLSQMHSTKKISTNTTVQDMARNSKKKGNTDLSHTYGAGTPERGESEGNKRPSCLSLRKAGGTKCSF